MSAPKFYSQKGFSLVELMVSLVISLFVGLAAMSSVQFFSSMQRQMVGAGASSANASTGLTLVKHELGQAGLGFFDKGKLLCPSVNLSRDSAPLLTSAAIRPVSLTTVSGRPVLSVFYGTALEAAGAAYLETNYSNSDPGLKIGTYLNVLPGQSVLVAPKDQTASPCTIKTVTSVTPSTGSGQTLNFDNTGAQNKYAFNVINYPAGSAVALLGQFVNTVLSVDDAGNLVMARPFTATSAVIARNVVAVSMQYGISDPGRATVSAWRFPRAYPLLEGGAEDWSALTAAQLSRVQAVKVSVLVRSEAKDKQVNGACAATPEMPSLEGQVLGEPLPSSWGLASTETIAPALAGDWGCYRYQETSVVVPLRNLQLGLNT